MNRREFLSLFAKVPVVAGAAYLGLRIPAIADSTYQIQQEGGHGDTRIGNSSRPTELVVVAEYGVFELDDSYGARL